jgi:putative redox protein
MPITVVATVDPDDGRVEARHGRSSAIAMDADEPEGLGELPGPKATLLAALAGCTSMDVASILRKKRQTVSAYEIEVTGDSASEHPRVFTDIRVEHRVRGDVTREALRRAIELSATRYCPVSAMLSAAARIEHHLSLRADDGGEHAGLVAVTGPGGLKDVVDPGAPGHEALRSS